ncbi:MAG TPA: MBL fold metallo-hydrolase, partial [Thermoanaerobaculia bacterium]|nr:MBL fold metallo-hydrolase [Thermoanaerobaculia bacterium]
RTIEIRHLGRGHTSGDLVVWLPKEGILAAGDLVGSPVPLVGSNQSHVGDWGATLAKLRALHPSMIVPGHGPVMHDDARAALMEDLFDSIKAQVGAAVAKGSDLQAVRKSVDLSEFRRKFAGDSKHLGFLFDRYVTGPAVESAYRDATGAK